MPIHNIEEIQQEAKQKLHEEDRKAAIQHEKDRLKARKSHVFSKRLRLQWPVRLEDHHQPLNRRRSDKGRTR